jgi:hypothetical protein
MTLSKKRRYMLLFAMVSCCMAMSLHLVICPANAGTLVHTTPIYRTETIERPGDGAGICVEVREIPMPESLIFATEETEEQSSTLGSSETKPSESLSGCNIGVVPVSGLPFLAAGIVGFVAGRSLQCKERRFLK